MEQGQRLFIKSEVLIMPDLNEFFEWAKQNPRRTVKIEIREGKLDIFVWDFDIAAYSCQRVNSVSEINLEAVAAKEEVSMYERLKAKYEGATVNA
jgi:hypothetical protein